MERHEDKGSYSHSRNHNVVDRSCLGLKGTRHVDGAGCRCSLFEELRSKAVAIPDAKVRRRAICRGMHYE